MRHGKWWDVHQDVPVESLMEGRFSRLFDNLPAASWRRPDLQKLATAMTAAVEHPPTPEGTTDSEENPGILAGYTYLGQFIDHDITYDPTSSLTRKLTNLDDLVDFRTPRLDLDNLYGRGPGDEPFLYDTDGKSLLLGDRLAGNQRDRRSRDLQRGPDGRALIGDPRNDENRIVAQLQATMIRFHNQLVKLNKSDGFDEIRNQVRWHYQWVVINDFLPTIINQTTIEKIFPHLKSGQSAGAQKPRPVIPALKQAAAKQRFFMPIEFSVAAYRFGHSMIRPIYRINESVSRRPIFSTSKDDAADLGGMRPLPSDWAVDWQFFFDIGQGGAASASPDDRITRAPQHAYKIDTSVVGALGHLPASVASDPSSLALRNLQRGEVFGLPSGEAVAAELGEAPIDVVIGKATTDPGDTHEPIGKIARSFTGKTPLWTYILSEAQVTSWGGATTGQNEIPIRLGPVGGRIVGEVFAAMLLADPTSFINAAPGFAPHPKFTRNGAFGIAELILAALKG